MKEQRDVSQALGCVAGLAHGEGVDERARSDAKPCRVLVVGRRRGSCVDVLPARRRQRGVLVHLEQDVLRAVARHRDAVDLELRCRLTVEVHRARPKRQNGRLSTSTRRDGNRRHRELRTEERDRPLYERAAGSTAHHHRGSCPGVPALPGQVEVRVPQVRAGARVRVADDVAEGRASREPVDHVEEGVTVAEVLELNLSLLDIQPCLFHVTNEYYSLLRLLS